MRAQAKGAPRRAALAGALTLALTACSDGERRMTLHPTPAPTGGAISALIAAPTTGAPLAFGREAIFRRAGSRWQPSRPRWPDELLAAATPPLDALARAGQRTNMPRATQLTSAHGMLWLLASRQAQPTTLWVSADEGLSWRTEPLPDADMTTEDALWRLHSTADALVLLHDHQGWRRASATGRWESMGLEEITAEERRRGPLPTVLRHHLPSAPTRDYELITALSDQLMIFRREARDPKLRMVSALPTVDRAVLAAPAGEPLYLLAPDTIYLGRERGEQWEAVGPTLAPRERLEVALAAPTSSSLETHALLLGTSAGRILRSVDQGQRWREVRAEDPSSRAITSLLWTTHDTPLWAGCEGCGVLRSDDVGERWSEDVSGLRAAQPLAMASKAGQLMLGSDAGLASLRGAPQRGVWLPQHEEAITTLWSAPTQLLAGTLTGELLRFAPSGGAERLASRSAWPNQRAYTYHPSTLTAHTPPDSAIVAIERRGDTIRATTHRLGMLSTQDQGQSWRTQTVQAPLRDALAGAEIADALVSESGVQLMVSRPFASRSPAQLWRSEDEGHSWHALRALEDVRAGHVVMLRARAPRGRAEELLLVRDGVIERSTDQGLHWHILPGPWVNREVLAFDQRHPDYDLMVLRGPRGEELLFLDRATLAVQGKYVLQWAPEVQARPGEIAEVLLVGRVVFVRTHRGLYHASLTSQNDRQPETMALWLGALVALTLTMLGYGTIKLGQRAKRHT